MSKTTLSVMLDELKIVRLTCKKCGSVTEISTDKLEKAVMLQCPTCPAQFRTSANDDTLTLLGRCIRLLTITEGNATDVEFVVAGKDSPSVSE